MKNSILIFISLIGLLFPSCNEPTSTSKEKVVKKTKQRNSPFLLSNKSIKLFSSLILHRHLQPTKMAS